MWSSESFEGKYNIGFEIPIEFPSQRSPSRNNEIKLKLKMTKSSSLKWTHGRSVIGYRVSLLFTRNLTTIEIGPASLKSIGQF